MPFYGVQNLVYIAAAFYAGGFVWHFVSRPGPAKKLIVLLLLAALVSLVAFIIMRSASWPRGLTFTVVANSLFLFFLMIPAFAACGFIWFGGIQSARRLRHYLLLRKNPDVSSLQS